MTETVELEPGIRRITAENPSPMTFRGTNTYLVGTKEVAVIDPGPAMPGHFDALMAALTGARVAAVLVTHTHLDHSPLATELGRTTGAPVFGFGRHFAGRSPTMAALAASGLAGGGEGIDPDFAPDEALSDGSVVDVAGVAVTAIHTPGHLSNHLTFAVGGALFTGDHVMGWASSLISPPDGDLGAFMVSCRALKGRGDRICYPGHGDPVTDPEERLDWLIAHRMMRERSIVAALADGPTTVRAIVARVYADVSPAMHAAAARNVLAHLIHLHERGEVTATPALTADATFALAL